MIDIGKKIIDDCPHLSHDGRCDICEEAALTAVWNAAVEACAKTQCGECAAGVPVYSDCGMWTHAPYFACEANMIHALSTAKAESAKAGMNNRGQSVTSNLNVNPDPSAE